MEALPTRESRSKDAHSDDRQAASWVGQLRERRALLVARRDAVRQSLALHRRLVAVRHELLSRKLRHMELLHQLLLHTHSGIDAGVSPDATSPESLQRKLSVFQQTIGDSTGKGGDAGDDDETDGKDEDEEGNYDKQVDRQKSVEVDYHEPIRHAAASRIVQPRKRRRREGKTIYAMEEEDDDDDVHDDDDRDLVRKIQDVDVTRPRLNFGTDGTECEDEDYSITECSMQHSEKLHIPERSSSHMMASHDIKHDGPTHPDAPVENEDKGELEEKGEEDEEELEDQDTSFKEQDTLEVWLKNRNDNSVMQRQDSASHSTQEFSPDVLGVNISIQGHDHRDKVPTEGTEPAEPFTKFVDSLVWEGDSEISTDEDEDSLLSSTVDASSLVGSQFGSVIFAGGSDVEVDDDEEDEENA